MAPVRKPRVRGPIEAVLLPSTRDSEKGGHETVARSQGSGAEGNIFYVYNARLPERAEGWDYSGDSSGDSRGELPGDTPETLWTDTLPFDELPQILNRIPSRASCRTPTARRSRPRSATTVLDEALDVLSDWDLDTGVDSRQAALALLALGRFIDSGDNESQPTDELLQTAVSEATEILRQHHQSLSVPWGDVNRLRHGDADLPIGGAPDVLRTVYGELQDDGRLKGVAGDSYILVVSWDAEGSVRSQSIHQFGSATRDESSPHCADQVEVFVRPGLKAIWMDEEEEVRRNLERAYHPGE